MMTPPARAFLAELRLRAIRVLASGTLHATRLPIRIIAAARPEQGVLAVSWERSRHDPTREAAPSATWLLRRGSSCATSRRRTAPSWLASKKPSRGGARVSPRGDDRDAAVAEAVEVARERSRGPVALEGRRRAAREGESAFDQPGSGDPNPSERLVAVDGRIRNAPAVTRPVPSQISGAGVSPSSAQASRMDATGPISASTAICDGR
jgi:hypothetical protein